MSFTPRLYVPVAYAPHAVVTVTEAQAHYLRTVLRLSEGAAVEVFNGTQGSWQAEVMLAGKKQVRLVTLAQTQPQPDPVPPLILYAAPIKKTPLDWLVQKATELGVTHLHPIKTQRTVVTRLNEGRILANAIEAAEQTERLTLPEIGDWQPLATALTQDPTPAVTFFADEAGEAQSLVPALEQHRASMAKGCGFVVGPEGGFAAEERRWLRAQPHVIPVSLGPRILRADTAALSLLTCYQAVVGDWQ